ncbi:MAG TPA: BLUF domain-containing protein [Verrucomicrobiae bacterium]|nr:BLUF domain-containing protein [Verrucomicrobiae bacterium]
MSKLFRMVYISTASKLFAPAELREMLKDSNERNKKTGITGMLLYKDGQFMQVLEGTAEAVTATFSRISKDPRHHGIMVLVKGAVQERRFPGWSMAFRDLNLPDHQKLPGYSEFLNTPLTGKEFTDNPDRCEKLLLVFKRNIR